MNNHHEKWIATVIWTVLLVALVYTSLFAWQTTATNTIFNINAPLWQDLRANTESDIRLIDWLYLMFNGFIGLFIILNWFRFADMSLDMFKAYAKGETPFARMLIYPLEYSLDNKDSDSDFDADEAESSMITSLLRNLGFTWVMIILIPPFMGILNKLIG